MSVERPSSKNVPEEDWPSSEDLEEWVRPFFYKFEGFAFKLDSGKLIYCHYNSKNKWFYCHPLDESDVERLMRKSLEVGEDLLLKECKDRPYDWGPRLVDENGDAGSLSESDYAGEQVSSVLESFKMDDIFENNDILGTSWSVFNDSGLSGLSIEDETAFFKKFGILQHNMLYSGGSLTYVRIADDQTYAVEFLGEDEVRRLVLLSLENGVDHLYEACKDRPVFPPPPGCLS